MANRVFNDLRKWIALDDDALDLAMRRIGVRATGPAHRARARRLFALALDTSGPVGSVAVLRHDGAKDEVLARETIGEGMRLFIVEQVSSFGTTLVSVNPGKVETRGGMPGAMGGSVRKLTLDDARALAAVSPVEARVLRGPGVLRPGSDIEEEPSEGRSAAASPFLE